MELLSFSSCPIMSHEENEPLINKSFSLPNRINVTTDTNQESSRLNAAFQSIINRSSGNRPYDNVGDVEEHGYRWKYDNYTTIDWIHDNIKDRIRYRNIRTSKSFSAVLYKHYDAAQAWIVLLLVGICCGFIASLIDIVNPVLEDLKSGFCKGNILLRQELCNNSNFEWINWSDISDIPSLEFFIFISAAIFYSHLSCRIVLAGPFHSIIQDPSGSEYKIVYHSASSGIPEVKTILSGFVIRGFLGFKTLVTKILALVC
jgi:chloride channel 3/4/5